MMPLFRHYVSLFIILALASSPLTAQDTSLVAPLSAPPPPCENVAYNAANEITHIPQGNVSSITPVISFWQQYCTTSEPLLRTKLLAAIALKLDISEIAAEYTQYYPNYRQRIYAQQNRNPNEAYLYDKILYGYVPFSIPFDTYTYNWAVSLIKQLPLDSQEYLWCTLFINDFNEFENLAYQHNIQLPYYQNTNPNQTPRNTENTYNPQVFTFVGLGTWIPLSPTFQNTFNAGLNAEISILGRIHNKWLLGARFAGILPSYSDTLYLDINDPQYLYGTQASTALQIGIQAGYFILQKDKIALRTMTALSYEALATNLPKNINYNGEITYYAIHGINSSISLECDFITRNGFSIGLFSRLHHTTYQPDAKLTTPLAGFALTAGIQANLFPY
jgi:hypothetical protein